MSLYVVKAKKTVLKANFAPGDATFTLDELVDSQGNLLSFTSFGEFGVVVIKQGTLVEIVKFSAILQNANGSATLTVASNGRDILPITPYSGDSSGQNFLAGAEVIVTNDPLTMSRFASLDNANTWDEIQTFEEIPETTGGNATTDNQLVRYAQALAMATGTTSINRVVVAGNAGETIVAGNFIYLKNSDGEWYKTDANDPATINNVILGIAQGAGTDGNSIVSGVLIFGLDSNQTGLTNNTPYFLSNTAGDISTTAGTTEMVVGNSRSTTSILFNPKYSQNLTAKQVAAAVGTSGTPSATNPFVTENDTSNGATKTATTISFTATTKTIADAGSGFLTANFRTGATITISGSASNNGNFTVVSVIAGEIVVAETLVDEASGASVTLTTVTANKIVRRRSTGDVTLPATPTEATDATSKAYVDLKSGLTRLAGYTPAGNTTENTVLTTTITGGSLSTSGSIRLRIPLGFGTSATAETWTIRLKFGGSTIQTITLTSAAVGGGTNTALNGFIEALIVNNASLSAQFVGFYASVCPQISGTNPAPIYASQPADTTSAVDTSINQTLAVTVQRTNGGGGAGAFYQSTLEIR